MTIRIAAAASVSRARPIPPAQTHGGNGAVERWVPAARALPVFDPKPTADFLALWMASGANHVYAYLPYDPLDWPLHQPDDPGVDPPAMRSPFSPLDDDGPEPSSSDRRAVTVICCLIAIAAAVGLIAVVSLGAS